MSSNFYWDGTGGARRAMDAVALVTGPQSSASLIGLWQGQAHPRWPNLTGVNAVVMNGTTSELQQALLAAKQAHLDGFWSTADSLLFWFARRKANVTASTRSVGLIAPMRCYWGINHNNPAAVDGGGMWMPMSDPSTYDNGVAIDTIINNIVPNGERQEAWINF